MDTEIWGGTGGWTSTHPLDPGGEPPVADGALGAEAAVREIFDCIPSPALLLNERGQVTLVNRLARDLIDASEGLSISEDGRLVLGHRLSREALCQAVARCARPAPIGQPDSAASQSLVLPRPGGRPLLLTLRRFGARHGGAVALLTLVDPDSGGTVRSASLRSLYGLSPAEARLAQAIASGLSLKQIAARDGLTYETVRSYVKQVLAKTGARRQADVVRLIGGLRDVGSWGCMAPEARAATS